MGKESKGRVLFLRLLPALRDSGVRRPQTVGKRTRPLTLSRSLHPLRTGPGRAQQTGASWEGFALEAAARVLGKRSEELAFWATHSGAEVDLFWQEHGRNWAVEVKYADVPRMTRSMTNALEDLDLTHLWVLYPGDRAYPLADKASTLPLESVVGSRPYPQAGT